MKYVLVALVVIIAYGIWRNNRKRTAPTTPKTTIRAAEEMVVCAHCGVHLPYGDAVQASRSAYYCCTEHQRLGAR